MVGGTAALYGVNMLVGRKKHTVYRISNDSLAKSKQVMIRILKLVEDGKKTPLDERSLPFEREQIKSAGKILAYYYLKQRLHEDYKRVKEGFIALSRFQDVSQEPSRLEALMKRDEKKLTQEFNLYIRRSPACEVPGRNAAACAETIEAESEPAPKNRN